jgi:hypothetical protein
VEPRLPGPIVAATATLGSDNIAFSAAVATIEAISLGMSASPRNLYPVERRGKDTASSLRRMHVVLLVRCARRADRSYRGVFIGPR